MFGASTTKPDLARFEVRYTVAGQEYCIEMRGLSAFHVRDNWDRKGSKLLSVEEVSARTELTNGSVIRGNGSPREKMRSLRPPP
jgi:primase-polymerase (primpol)-like protein